MEAAGESKPTSAKTCGGQTFAWLGGSGSRIARTAFLPTFTPDLSRSIVLKSLKWLDRGTNRYSSAVTFVKRSSGYERLSVRRCALVRRKPTDTIMLERCASPGRLCIEGAPVSLGGRA